MHDKNAAVCADLNQRTFKGKMIELVVQIGHHVSSGAALTEEVDPPDEVCDHLTEGAAVLESIPWTQHALVQNHPQVVPSLLIPGSRIAIIILELKPF